MKVHRLCVRFYREAFLVDLSRKNILATEGSRSSTIVIGSFRFRATSKISPIESTTDQCQKRTLRKRLRWIAHNLAWDASDRVWLWRWPTFSKAFGVRRWRCYGISCCGPHRDLGSGEPERRVRCRDSVWLPGPGRLIHGLDCWTKFPNVPQSGQLTRKGNASLLRLCRRSFRFAKERLEEVEK